MFWAYTRARESYELTGEFNGFPPEMADHVDSALLESVRAGYDQGMARGWRMSSAPIYEIHPAPGVTEEDSVAALGVCQDGTGILVHDADGNVVKQGNRGSYYVFFRYAEGKLKLFRLRGMGDELCS